MPPLNDRKNAKRPGRRVLVLLLTGVVNQAIVHGASPGIAKLTKALYYSDLYNWDAATPLFKEAEQLLHTSDEKLALQAHIGALREERARPLPVISKELAHLLASNQYLLGDDHLRLFALAVKGDIDGSIDAAMARDDWSQVVTLSKRLHNSKWVYRAEGQLGFCDYYQGDLASTQKRVTLAITEATKSEDWGAQVFFLSTMGLGLSSLNMPDASALEYIQRAIAVAANHPDIGEPFIANGALVEVMAKTGRINEAQQEIEALLAKRDLTAARRIDYNCAAGYVALAAEQKPKAIYYFEQALAVARGLGNFREAATVEVVLAGLYIQQGDMAKAEMAGKGAVDRFERDGVLSELPGSIDVYAQILVAQRQYIAARTLYERAEAIQDSLVGKGDSITNKTAAITGADQLYAHHFALIAEQFRSIEPAYEVIERGRARAVADLLLARGFSSPTSIALDRKIAQLRIQMAGLHAEDALLKQETAIFLAQASRSANPAVSFVGSQPFIAVSMAKLQSRLRPTEAILEYVLADPRSYVLVITAASKAIVPIESRKNIDACVKEYLRKVQQHSPATLQAARLYQLLIGPIPHIRKVTQYTVVPDGLLNNLPIEALMDGGRYLVQDHVVSYCPSSTILYALRNKPPRLSQSKSVLAIGDVPYNRNVARAEVGMTKLSRSSALPDLPNSGPEARIALQSIPSPSNRSVFGGDATETNVKQFLRAGFDYVHLAVHAYASDDPNQAAIVVLSDPMRGEDGVIEAAEISHQRIDSRLVVLSACETALGPIQGQEEISSLTTAFLVAGSRAVVSTLWRIEDHPARLLMEAFYSHLGHGEPVADSLAGAKRDVLSKFGQDSPPEYWAGYVMQGN